MNTSKPSQEAYLKLEKVLQVKRTRLQPTWNLKLAERIP